MKNYDNITITQYLEEKGIKFKSANGELLVKCLFAECDMDSRPNEAHLYFSEETGQYHCKKCDAKGNIVTLAQHLGDISKGKTYKKVRPATKAKTQPKTPKLRAMEMPEYVKEYLHERGIDDSLISLYQIGWTKQGFSGKITIPVVDSDGNTLFYKLRRDPSDNDESEPKYKVYPTGSSAALYRIGDISNSTSLIICEGEFDQMMLTKHGFDAVSSTAGAGTFKDEWFDKIKHITEVYICFDNDKTGVASANSLAHKLYQKIESVIVHNILLPNDNDCKDVTDYFCRLQGTPDELLALAQKVDDPNAVNRIISVPTPKQDLDFNDWLSVIEKYFPQLVTPAKACLSIIAQMLVTDITNPFGLVLIDVPSSGKTIVLNFFAEIKDICYVTDKFTPASFVSNSANVKREKLAEIDLLPRLRYKTFFIRDLATLFSKREDDLQESLGILTRVMDGEGLSTDTGVHGQRQYVGEFYFNLLAASTPISPKVQKTMSNLGSRLFFMNMDAVDKTERDLAQQLSDKSYKKKEKECRNVSRDFIHTLWNTHKGGVEWDKASDDEEIRMIIARCAKLLAKLRGAINLWKSDYSSDDDSYSYTKPIVEKPDRLNQLFYNLARGHALINGRTQLDKSDLFLVLKICLDSGPRIRSLLFKELLKHGGVLHTALVEGLLNCSKPTALKEMKSLVILELVTETKKPSFDHGANENSIQLKSDFTWFLSEEAQSIMGIEADDTLAYLADAGLVE